MVSELSFIDALMSFLRLDNQCKMPWRVDEIHCTPRDYLVYRYSHKGAAAGLYVHTHDGFLDIGKFEHSYEHITDGVFTPILLIPLPEMEVSSG